jgi:hypothetical protein
MADMFLNAWYLQSSFMGSVYPTCVTLILNSVCLRYYVCVSLFNIGVLRNGVHEFTISVILNLLRSLKMETKITHGVPF